jgi:hypothetical protein
MAKCERCGGSDQDGVLNVVKWTKAEVCAHICINVFPVTVTLYM